MLGSVTVLPAMLVRLGNGWSRRAACPFLGKRRHRNRGESRVWGAILDRVLRASGGLASSLAGGLLVALAIPALQHAHHQPGRRRPAAEHADHADLRPHPGRLPRRPGAGRGRRQGGRRHRARRSSRAIADARAQALATRPADGAGHIDDQPGQAPWRSSRIPITGDGTDDALGARARHPARGRRPGDDRQRARRRGGRDRLHRRVEGLQRRDEVAPAARVRLRARRSRSCCCWSRSARSSSRSRRSC